MLDLDRAFVGCPASDVHILTTEDVILLVYAYGDSVILVNARTFAFVRALAFFEVFPFLRGTLDRVKCVSIEPGMKLVAASLGHRLAFWSLSGVEQGAWRVHSSLTSHDEQEVSAIDCKAGLLGVASVTCLAVYTLGLEDNLPVWSKKWVITAQPCSVVRLSPSLMHLSIIYQTDHTVHIYSTASGSLLQSLRHPRAVKDFIWRFSSKSRRDDLVLYTITDDDTLRIFLPVLDTPHLLQLHASFDLYSDHTEDPEVIEHKYSTQHSNVFWLHKDTISTYLDTTLLSDDDIKEDGYTKRLVEMAEDGWDFFFRISGDNSLIMRALAHIDRRPPTLLRSFTLLQPQASLFLSYPNHLHILHTPKNKSITVVTSPPLRTYKLDFRHFVRSGGEGLTLLSQGPDSAESNSSRILRLVRTPEGHGLTILREDITEAWHLNTRSGVLRCVNRFPKALLASMFDHGRLIVLYTNDCNPKIQLFSVIDAELLATESIPHLSTLLYLTLSESHVLIGITETRAIVKIKINIVALGDKHRYNLVISPTAELSNSESLILVTAIDPMGWSKTANSQDGRAHDTLMSLSDEGELVFWCYDEHARHEQWHRSGRVRTGRSGYRLACCSSAKKTALVFSDTSGDQLSIWDSKESEFSSGLEYVANYQQDVIRDLDWTATLDLQSILAVGFTQHILIICQQRTSYFDEQSGWTTLRRIEIDSLVTYPISDSTWLAGGTFVVGAGHLLLKYGKQPTKRLTMGEDELFERVAWLNGPLPDYHPQMVLQCLLWGKTEFVKETVVKLYDLFRESHDDIENEWVNQPVERLLDSERASHSGDPVIFSHTLYDNYVEANNELPSTFSGPVVQYVISRLQKVSFSHLSKKEKAHLIVLFQATLEAEAQSRALDSNGLRYLISLRSFYILNAMNRANSHDKTNLKDLSENEFRPKQRSDARERLRYRDMVWAFHSESQEILLSACTSACGGRIKWADARALGMFLWLNSAESMKTLMEAIAQNHYMLSDDRDPTTCSLFYFALGKVRLVQGLWRQASWHKEQSIMLKFLANDFTQTRWRTAALKNAYTLLSKQRYEYAAAFFVLGGGLKDAANVCVRYLNDPQLAVALARVVENGEDKPVFKSILNDVMIPTAFESGNRWLASWAFWQLKRRDLAVRVLVSPLEDIMKASSAPIQHIGEQNYDDTSLALLFGQLKMKTLQTAKGANEVSEATEFNFVLQIARIFCRMGCHSLALFLVKTWSFDRPSLPRKTDESRDILAALPDTGHRPSFGHKRRSSILIDMDVPSLPSTRAASPKSAAERSDEASTMRTESSNGIGATGLGSLMKTAKHDVSVPEFDMNAFF